jgi:hypothetical protein
MQVEHDLTIEDAVAFQRYQLAHPSKPERSSWMTWFGIACLGVLILVMASPLLWGGGSLWSLLILFLYVAVVAYALFYRRIVASVLRRKLREPGFAKLLGWRRLDVTSDGISITTATTNSTTKWSGVSRLVATEEHAFFYLSPVEAYILPKRAFGAQNEFWDFVETARQYRDEDRLRCRQLRDAESHERTNQDTGIKSDDRSGL